MKIKYSQIKEDTVIENIYEEFMLIKRRYQERSDYKSSCQKYNYTNDFGYYINNFGKTCIDSTYRNLIKFLCELLNQRESESFLEYKVKKQYPEPPFNEIGLQLIKRYFQPLIKHIHQEKHPEKLKAKHKAKPDAKPEDKDKNKNTEKDDVKENNQEKKKKEKGKTNVKNKAKPKSKKNKVRKEEIFLD